MQVLRDYLRELGRSWLIWTLLIADLLGVVALLGILDVETLPALVAGALFGGAGLAWASFAVYRAHSPEGAVGGARRDLHGDPAAVDRLADTPDPQATALLAECSANAGGAFTRDVQIRAALRLGYRGDPRAAPGLTVCLGSVGPDEDRPPGTVRVECARAAARVGEPLRAAIVGAVTSDPDAAVRREALRALEQLGTGPGDVPALASAAHVDPPLAARLLAGGGLDAVEPLVGLLAAPDARGDAARALATAGPTGVGALVERLAGDVRAPVSALDEFLGSVPGNALDALGLAPPERADAEPDPVIAALAALGADVVPLVSPAARTRESHLPAVAVLERIGAPALGELAFLVALRARYEGLEWSEDERQELATLVARPVRPDLGEPRGHTGSGEPAAFEALCWAGRDRRDGASPWLVRVLERSPVKPQRAWAAIALHLLWAGARQPPDSVKRALLGNLPFAADPEASVLPPGEAMDRTFHANWLGATIAAAAAVCREQAVPALTAAAEQLEAEPRGFGVESPYARQAEASRAALRRIARHEPLVTLSILDGWPWPVDRS